MKSQPPAEYRESRQAIVKMGATRTGYHPNRQHECLQYIQHLLGQRGLLGRLTCKLSLPPLMAVVLLGFSGQAQKNVHEELDELTVSCYQRKGKRHSTFVISRGYWGMLSTVSKAGCTTRRRQREAMRMDDSVGKSTLRFQSSPMIPSFLGRCSWRGFSATRGAILRRGEQSVAMDFRECGVV